MAQAAKIEVRILDLDKVRALAVAAEDVVLQEGRHRDPALRVVPRRALRELARALDELRRT